MDFLESNYELFVLFDFAMLVLFVSFLAMYLVQSEPKYIKKHTITKIEEIKQKVYDFTSIDDDPQTKQKKIIIKKGFKQKTDNYEQVLKIDQKIYLYSDQDEKLSYVNGSTFSKKNKRFDYIVTKVYEDADNIPTGYFIVTVEDENQKQGQFITSDKSLQVLQNIYGFSKLNEFNDKIEIKPNTSVTNEDEAKNENQKIKENEEKNKNIYLILWIISLLFLIILSPLLVYVKMKMKK